MINKPSDIIIGREYCFYLVKDRRKKRHAIVHALINENEAYPDVKRTEAYVTIFYGRDRVTENLLFLSEFGIGETHEEAYQNYGRFKHEENPNFETSAKRVEERMLKVPVARLKAEEAQYQL